MKPFTTPSATPCSRALAAIGLSLAALAPAAAGPLVAFTDGDPLAQTSALLQFHWAVSWSQATATRNVSLSALILANVQGPGGLAGHWYVTRALGPGATAADVLYAGAFDALPPQAFDPHDYNGAPRTLLGSGLDFDAGAYYLVLDGPDDGVTQWVGGEGTVALAAGFSIGSYLAAAPTGGFVPASDFAHPGWLPASHRLVFEMEEVANAVPSPSTLLLASLGLGWLGVCRAQRPAAPPPRYARRPADARPT